MERIAHRGAKRELPENTLEAFRRAFDRGADAVELDVHATRDGVVVVHHDPRVPARIGRAMEIATSGWDAIRRLDLGGGTAVPRLADVFEATPSGRAVYVEIKGRGIEEAVVAVVRKSGVASAIHSFDHDAIARIRQLAPEIPRGILLEERGVDIVTAMQRTGARDVWPNWKLIDASLVDLVHANGGRVIAWTVNDRITAERLASLGVDGVCGDDVRLFEGL